MNLQISTQGLNLIKLFEGYHPKPYLCIARRLTIGYGHILRKNENFTSITKDQAHNLLVYDLSVSEQAVLRLIKAQLLQHQFDMLVSFTFNLGAGALQRSSLRAKLNRLEYDEVPQELLRWIYAAGKPSHGLLKRRQFEAFIYSNGYT